MGIDIGSIYKTVLADDVIVLLIICFVVDVSLLIMSKSGVLSLLWDSSWGDSRRCIFSDRFCSGKLRVWQRSCRSSGLWIRHESF